MRRRVKNNIATQCIGKIGHTSRKGAFAEMKRAKDLSLSIYQCPHCGKYHVGHAIGWVAKRVFQGLRR